MTPQGWITGGRRTAWAGAACLRHATVLSGAKYDNLQMITV